MIDYPHSVEGEISAPGVPDDIKFLANKLDTLNKLAEKMRHIVAQSAKQPVQLHFFVPGGAAVSNIYLSTIRARMKWLVIPQEPNGLLAVSVSGTRTLRNLGGHAAVGGVLPISLEIEPGIEYQIIGQSGVVQLFAGGFDQSVWMVGTLEGEA